MLTLYHAPRSRSSRFIWLLEELATPYEIKLATIRRGDGSGELDASNPHPHGKVPTLVHDGAAVFESPAIALYLTDAFPQSDLGPLVGDPKRGAYLSWLAYYGDVLEPAIMSKFMNVGVPRGTAGWVAIDEVADFLFKRLTAAPYLLGDKFTAADVLFSSTFALFANSPLFPKSPSIDIYVKRCLDRPAYGRAQARDSGGSLG